MSARGRHIGLPLQLMPAYAGMTTCKDGFETRPYQEHGVTCLKANRYEVTVIAIGEAQRKVLEAVPVLGRERVYIVEALGRVLAQDVPAKRDVPAADNSAMDGYSCRYEDVAGADSANPAKLRIIGDSPAGRPYYGTVGAGEAVRIMTGGLIPSGADTVIMVEYTRTEGEYVYSVSAIPVRAHISDCTAKT